MATILITEQPVSQVVPGGAEPADMTVVATYDGAETLLYQWYECDDELGTNPEAISGAVADTTTFGMMTPGGTTYYYCELSATDVAEDVLTDIVSVYQLGLLPEKPAYLTGEYVLDYIGQCSLEVQDRFTEALALSGIEIPDTTDVLRTAQVELFMSVI